MNYFIDIQRATKHPIPVTDDTLRLWIEKTLESQHQEGELTLRLVDDEEMIYLNQTYRKIPKTTNVLSFPADIPKNITLDCPLLGDIIISPAVLENESQFQEKLLIAHWAHIVIHGVLHLLGYDHIQPADEEIMQQLEINLLAKWGFNNPYLLSEENYFE